MALSNLHILIVDDELKARNLMSSLLSKYEFIEKCIDVSTVSSAFEYVQLHTVDLIFLDIKMHGENGFELVDKLKIAKLNIDIIFITAYDEYALKAIKAHAFDYILKPIDPDELTNSLLNFLSYQKSKSINEKLDELILDSTIPEKIKFNTRSGFILIDQKEIVYCEADNNYTNIHLTSSRKEVSSLNLGKVLELLTIPIFKRIGRSIIINDNFLYKIDRKTGKCFLKANEEIIQISIPGKSNWDDF